MSAPTQISVGAALPGEQFAALGSAAIKLITDLQEQSNSPDEIKAGIARARLARMDALVLAQQQNDLETERKAFEVQP
jgi:hypothetical protein